MAQREKRSVSFPPELAKDIDRAAAAAGSSFSAWIAETASLRLRLEAGRRGVAEWEIEHGPLTEQELAEGLVRARELLGRTSSSSAASSSSPAPSKRSAPSSSPAPSKRSA